MITVQKNDVCMEIDERALFEHERLGGCMREKPVEADGKTKSPTTPSKKPRKSNHPE